MSEKIGNEFVLRHGNSVWLKPALSLTAFLKLDSGFLILPGMRQTQQPQLQPSDHCFVTAHIRFAARALAALKSMHVFDRLRQGVELFSENALVKARTGREVV